MIRAFEKFDGHRLISSPARIASLAMIGMTMMGTAHAGDHVTVEVGDGKYHLYRARPAELTLHWKNSEGVPYRTFDELLEDLQISGKRVSFMVNAGIFEPGGIPTGLHIQGGKELRPLNLAEGRGNFYLKPNGVFYVGDDGAHIVTSENYASIAPNPRFAVQSGPMLLIDGRAHPKFNAPSKSRLHRNGVGILPDGRVIFIMTDLTSGTRTNLFQFAMMFQKYGCKDALFLDGDLSKMRIDDGKSIEPADARDPAKRELAPGVAAGDKFGGILAIVEDGAPTAEK